MEGEKVWGRMREVKQWGELDRGNREGDFTEIDIRPVGEEEDTRQRERKPAIGELVMYTDGSMREGRVGAGVWWETRRGEEERTAYLGTKMEVFDAEMFAIWMARGGQSRPSRRVHRNHHQSRQPGSNEESHPILHGPWRDEGPAHPRHIQRRQAAGNDSQT